MWSSVPEPGNPAYKYALARESQFSWAVPLHNSFFFKAHVFNLPLFHKLNTQENLELHRNQGSVVPFSVESYLYFLVFGGWGGEASLFSMQSKSYFSLFFANLNALLLLLLLL